MPIVLPDIKLANSTDNIFADFIRDWTTKETIDKLKIKIKIKYIFVRCVS